MTQALDQEGIANWRNNWLQLIVHFSNIELQRERWLNPEKYPSPYWSFVEFFCMYFNDLGLESGYEIFVASGNVTAPEAGIIQAFHIGLSNYKSPMSNDNDQAAILSDPKWVEVVALASQAIEKLESLPLSEADRRAIRCAV